MRNRTLERLKERYWEEVYRNVEFFDDNGNRKVEEMSGRDFNQFEALCDQLASVLVKRWGSEVKWQLVQ